jgi:SAM-dependent methyltransferase
VPLNDPLATQVKRYAEIIRTLVKKIEKNANVEQEIQRIARQRARRPIDYMRYAEFGAVVGGLRLQRGSRILDAAGPQWLTFALAAQHPDVEFHYINLTDYELLPFMRLRELLELDNITIRREDLRKLSFPDEHFDEILSISVIEHVYPEEGGDILALRELKRVIKNEGSIIITVPCKEKANVVYIQGDVYERSGTGKQFFAREYSPETLAAMVNRLGFLNDGLNYISEVPSLSSIDYLEWGPLRGTWRARLLLRLYRGVERLLRIPVEEILALHKLSVTTGETPRLVNAVLHLTKAD